MCLSIPSADDGAISISIVGNITGGGFSSAQTRSAAPPLPCIRANKTIPESEKWAHEPGHTEGPVRKRAQRPVQRRAPAREGNSEDDQGDFASAAQGGFSGPSQEDRRARPPAGDDL